MTGEVYRLTTSEALPPSGTSYTRTEDSLVLYVDDNAVLTRTLRVLLQYQGRPDIDHIISQGYNSTHLCLPDEWGKGRVRMPEDAAT